MEEETNDSSDSGSDTVQEPVEDDDTRDDLYQDELPRDQIDDES